MKRAGEFMPQERRRPTRRPISAETPSSFERARERVPLRRTLKGTRQIKRGRTNEMAHGRRERERKRRRDVEPPELSNFIISNDQFRRPIKNYASSYLQRQFYLRVCFNEKLFYILRPRFEKRASYLSE